MHLVTSSLFLPSVIEYLSPASNSLLLRGYFAALLATWVSRDRPAIDIKNFYASNSSTVSPHPPGPAPALAESALTPGHPYPNSWSAILTSTMQHPNEHLIKVQRTLAHWAALFGGVKQGRWSGPKAGAVTGEATELQGAELLDGTLFVRTAGLTQERLGWIREGGKKGDWDLDGF